MFILLIKLDHKLFYNVWHRLISLYCLNQDMAYFIVYNIN